MNRKALLGIGIGVAAVGVTAAVVISRRKKGETKLLGRAKRRRPNETIRRGGMTLQHHRSQMPIEERVGILQDVTYRSVQDPNMRKLALQITRSCPARDGDCEAKAIYGWMKKNIRYTGDIGPHKLGRKGPVEGIDLFQGAARTAEFGGGDCDDHSILGCTLALHNGLACKFRVTSPSKKGNEYSHIYAMVGLPKNGPSKWVALDTTLDHGRFGTEAPYGRALDFVA